MGKTDSPALVVLTIYWGRGTEVTYSVLPSKSGPVVTYDSYPLPWPLLAMLAICFIHSIIPYVFCLTNTSILFIMS